MYTDEVLTIYTFNGYSFSILTALSIITNHVVVGRNAAWRKKIK
jgi:hypothetical protein